jgi:hypothetical protein
VPTCSLRNFTISLRNTQSTRTYPLPVQPRQLSNAAGVQAAVILDGRIPHVLLLELFTEHGAGTLIAA